MSSGYIYTSNRLGGSENRNVEGQHKLTYTAKTGYVKVIGVRHR